MSRPEERLLLGDGLSMRFLNKFPPQRAESLVRLRVLHALFGLARNLWAENQSTPAKLR